MNTPTVDSRSLVELRLSACWRDGEDSHMATRHVERFNVWRDLDLFPPALRAEILGRPAGHKGRQAVTAADIVEPWSKNGLHRIRPAQFRRHTRQGVSIDPALGRFYPRGLAEGLPDVFIGNARPMRVVESDADHLLLDFNHPLAGKALEVAVDILGIERSRSEHGGRCGEALVELLDGPGMQMRHGGQPTDFFAEGALSRLDDAPDSRFYSLPRMVQHLDSACLGELEALYRPLLAGRARVLDLMASWDSHLPADGSMREVTGLGMNREELLANPALAVREVADLNDAPRLPFPDAHFDAVICTVSVEYLTRPLEVFREVQRVLAPGGLFVCSFSNRWFPTKSISVWKDLHEFERMGLVAEYFKRTPGFGALSTWSLSGLPRPEDDPHWRESPWSDPLYAVWACKEGEAGH